MTSFQSSAFSLLILLTTVWAGCTYDHKKEEYGCGDHGICKQTELNKMMVLRFCVCKKGYEGTKLCSKPCKDCCSQLEEQCYARRFREPCKIPRCLRKVLNSRKCPKESPKRQEINRKMWSYVASCQKKRLH